MTGKEGGSDAGGGGTGREHAQVARELRSLEHAEKQCRASKPKKVVS